MDHTDVWVTSSPAPHATRKGLYSRSTMGTSLTCHVWPRPILVAVLLGSTLVVAAGHLLGQPTEITYRAQGKDCPTEHEFVEEVQRTVASSTTQPSPNPRQFTVILEDHRGTFSVRNDDGESTNHVVQGASCAEVGSALALSLALALAPSTPTPPPQALPGSAPQSTPPESAEPEHPQWALGLGAVGMIGPTPPALGGTGFLDFPRSGGRIVAPQLRLGATYAQTIAPSSGAVGIRWQWYLVRADLCGLHFATATYGMRLCAALDAGMIVSRPTGLANARAALWVAWLAPGLGVRFFGVISGVRLELGTGLTFPVPRYGYSYLDYQENGTSASDKQVYRIHPVGGTFFLGAAFPWS